MQNFSSIKDDLIKKLWIPFIKSAAKTIAPRKRKHKNLRVFTLTSDVNYNEIDVIAKEDLASKEKIVAWSHSHLKIVRLETDIAPSRVIGLARYENSILSSNFPLINEYNFDILNLDFFSQEPIQETGRTEKEIISVEKSLKLQKDQDKFILIYTTLLNSKSFNLGCLQNSSDSFHEKGWQGLSTGKFPSIINDNSEKMACIESIFTQLFNKYDYKGNIKKKNIKFERKKFIVSFAGLLIRS